VHQSGEADTCRSLQTWCSSLVVTGHKDPHTIRPFGVYIVLPSQLLGCRLP
jgi:hypothetical protein